MYWTGKAPDGKISARNNEGAKAVPNILKTAGHYRLTIYSVLLSRNRMCAANFRQSGAGAARRVI